MASANIASTGIVLEVLTRDNYLDWSALVKNYLKGKKLWNNVVECTCAELPEGQKTLVVESELPEGQKTLVVESEIPEGQKTLVESELPEGQKTLVVESEILVVESELPEGQKTLVVESELPEGQKTLVVESELPERQKTLKDEDWQSKNAQALHAIQLSCGHYALRQIRNCETAQEAWNHLKAEFSEHLRADNDIEQGGLESDIESFHEAVKKGMWNVVNNRIENDPDILIQKSLSSGWNSLHVAVDAGQDKIIEELVNLGNVNVQLLKEKDWNGYTPFALAAKSTDDTEMVKRMLDKGGNDLLTTKIKDDDGKGDIPVLLAAIKGHKEMTRFLFDKTPQSTLLVNDCYYGAKLLSHCIHAEIFDIAAALLQHSDPHEQIPLTYESDQCTRPIYGLAHIPTAFPSGTRFSWFERIFGSKKMNEIKNKHDLAGKILKCLCEKVKRLSSESKLSEWSVPDAMLQAAKYGIIEFINSMREANPSLLWAEDKNKRGIFAHAILNRQDKVFKLIYEIEDDKRLKTSEDIFQNNLLHLAAELGPSSYRGRRSNAALQMQRELKWFKAVENIVPLMCKEAKNADGLTPRELFTKNHEHLVNEGRQWAKDTASSFTIVGTLIITIMFAAAFTVPGGNNQDKGLPIFLGKNAFSLFIMADALSLVASSSSVLMFIGILTSRYAEEDFNKRLPGKLLFGLFTIFLSVLFMMCAFCSGLALMLKGYRWIIITGISISVIPILVLLGTLMRLFYEICKSCGNI